jgi:hypothetical protein
MRTTWDLASVREEARKYSTVRSFKDSSRGAYKWAQRHGMVADVTAFMSEITCPRTLLDRIDGELGSAARYAVVAKRLTEDEPFECRPVDSDPEAISDGNFMDFEAQMYDQSSEERSDKALDAIEALQNHGTPEQVGEAWGMYLDYQRGNYERWVKRRATSGKNVPADKHGG